MRLSFYFCFQDVANLWFRTTGYILLRCVCYLYIRVFPNIFSKLYCKCLIIHVKVSWWKEYLLIFPCVCLPFPRAIFPRLAGFAAGDLVKRKVCSGELLGLDRVKTLPACPSQVTFEGIRRTSSPWVELGRSPAWALSHMNLPPLLITSDTDGLPPLPPLPWLGSGNRVNDFLFLF